MYKRRKTELIRRRQQLSSKAFDQREGIFYKADLFARLRERLSGPIALGRFNWIDRHDWNLF